MVLDVWDRIPRNTIDHEARCVSCMAGIPLEKKILALPCGHGLYCQMCIDRQNCLVYDSEMGDTMSIHI